MRTIKVTPDPDLTRTAVLDQVAASQARGEEMSDQCAAYVADLWQSSGTVGRVLAGLASGAQVNTLALHKDVSDTIWHHYAEASLADKRMLDMLGTWSLSKLRTPEPTEEHIILVAFSVTETDRKAAQERLLPALQPVLESNGGPAESWWVAEDDRIDGSDNDSAVFVPTGQQELVSSMLARNALTPTWNVVARSETDE